jgi:hypothetical protein
MSQPAGNPELAAFAAQVKRNQEQTEVSAGGFDLRCGDSVAQIRRRGSAVTKLWLQSERSGGRVPVMHCGPNRNAPKVRAGHPMMPVGPSTGIGGQHGYLRYVDYSIESPYLPNRGSLGLRFQGAKGLPMVRRRFELGENAFTAWTLVRAGDTAIDTSIGHHDYYPLARGDYDGLTVNGQSLDALLDEEGATQAIMNGSSRLWEGYDGTNAAVQFPNGMEIDVAAEAVALGQAGNVEMSMLLWREPGAEYLCFEPALGVTKTALGLTATGVHIDPGSSVGLAVTTTLR